MPSRLSKDEAHIGGLGNAIGMRGWNQQINPATAESTVTRNGITFTKNGDGSITVNGTASSNATYTVQSVQSKLFVGHKYLLKGCPLNHNSDDYYLQATEYDGSHEKQLARHFGGSGVIAVATTPVLYTVFFLVRAGVTVSNLKIIPQFIDLTTLFGAGNESSSAEDFRAMFSADYYPYCSGGFADLLWENASPTSAFAQQTIPLDTSTYSKLLVVCLNAPERTDIYTSIVIDNQYMRPGQETRCLATAVRYNDSIKYIILRSIGMTYSSNPQISCSTAYETDTNLNEHANNLVMIPFRIYGIK